MGGAGWWWQVGGAGWDCGGADCWLRVVSKPTFKCLAQAKAEKQEKSFANYLFLVP